MEHGRSYLMDECQVMASGGVRPPAIIVPTLALSLCHRKQVSLSANNMYAPGLQGARIPRIRQSSGELLHVVAPRAATDS
jgi:hypothetical protein